jgi:hypothetical protein
MSTDQEGATNTPGATGGVNFDLQIPNGESISTINVHLTCDDGIDQNHVYDVVDGEVVGAIGGLTPGAQCHVDMTAQTPAGTDCLGGEDFTVVQDVTTPVVVTLMCQGINDGGAGSARVTADFELKECNVDRIRKIWAIPANLLEGESTTVEVEAWPGSLVTLANPAVWSFQVLSGGVVAAGGSCEGDACNDFTCGAVPVGSPINPDTLLPTNVVTVEVRVEDDDCYDTETVFVECGQASVCGNGTAEGLEECDGLDGVTLPDECGPAGDPDQCQIRTCGDGVQNTAAEECDGTDGVGANQGCDASCQLFDLPFCGDNIVNQPSEECDGTDTPVGQTCDASCLIVPFCGNGIQEAGEACDGTDGVTAPDTCDAACNIVPGVAPNACLDCLEVNPDVSTDVSGCLADTVGCGDMLECITSSGCYYPQPSDCYCGDGADPDACEGPSFVPTGDCYLEMQAAAGTTVNADVLANVNLAILLMDYGVTQVCIAECAF